MHWRTRRPANSFFRAAAVALGSCCARVRGASTRLARWNNVRPFRMDRARRTEILRDMLYRGSDVINEVSWVVFDEVSHRLAAHPRRVCAR
jgi:hypothetical protein